MLVCHATTLLSCPRFRLPAFRVFHADIAPLFAALLIIFIISAALPLDKREFHCCHYAAFFSFDIAALC